MLDQGYASSSEKPNKSEIPTGSNAKYEAKVITRGNCMMCGRKLTEGLFFCKECEAESEDKNEINNNL